MVAAGGPARLLVMIHNPAAGEGLVDLRIEVVAIGQHEEREVAAELAMDLACEQGHRVALAGPLSVPEYAQLTLPLAALPDRLQRSVDPQELVVLGQDFAG